MEEGDIVYYESAKCLHGRMAPLTGKDAFYVNLFAHYRPDGDPEWSSKPIPEGQAEKIISLDNVDVNTVMPHLAATKKILHSGRDLLDLWQRSAAGGSSIQGYDEL